ncbi:MAG TPA: amidohydrolase family protein, partial [Thermoanaerobaculia bacterium]|nr:amidohydrolase family protein [Thermoanaerobaculia bacterium]
MVIIENGDVYTPAPRGRQSVVVAGGRIERIGPPVDASAFEPQVIDASGCIVVPGLIDPHVHLIGGSGEKGFASASSAIAAEELRRAGITTVVGLLGTDTTTKTLPSLLAKVKALREEGVNAWMWTGGYDARSLTGNVRDDIILVEEIVGAGEIAIADRRGVHFDARSLARLASDCYVAGTLTGKAGVLHLHTGELRERLSIVRELLEMGIPATALHPTHVNRNEGLLAEAAELTRHGVAVDLDVVEEDLPRWLRAFDGDRSLVTISTDSPIGRPAALLEQIAAVIREKVLSIEEAFALATRNTARVLKLRDAGEIAVGKRADLLILEAESLAIRHVVTGGVVWASGQPVGGGTRCTPEAPTTP